MAATRLRIFISSVQKEFETLRRDLKAFLLGDAALRRFVSEVFLFEELPASDQRADEVYLSEVQRCDIYLGIFGYEYGNEDAQGISPTEHEYACATTHRKTRLIYVWGTDETRRAPKMKKLIRRASAELVRRRVDDTNALNSEVYASLVDYLERNGALRVPPFDTSACDGATIADLSIKRMEWFLETARRERAFPLKSRTAPEALLKHLNLLADARPTNAALLLFGSAPQRFHRSAETKCVSCLGQNERTHLQRGISAGRKNHSKDSGSRLGRSRRQRGVPPRWRKARQPLCFERGEMSQLWDICSFPTMPALPGGHRTEWDIYGTIGT
jgi:hypothetical protein